MQRSTDLLPTALRFSLGESVFRRADDSNGLRRGERKNCTLNAAVAAAAVVAAVVMDAENEIESNSKSGGGGVGAAAGARAINGNNLIAQTS